MLKLITSAIIFSTGLLLIGCNTNPVSSVGEQEQIVTGAVPSGVAATKHRQMMIGSDKVLSNNQTVTFSANCPKTFKDYARDNNNVEWEVTYKVSRVEARKHVNLPFSIIRQNMKVGGSCSVTIKAHANNVQYKKGGVSLTYEGKAASWKKTGIKN